MDNSYLELFSGNVKGFKVNGNGQASGHCPFHNDNKPSFSVNISTGLWNCHGCEAKGNAYQFAERIGIDPSPYKSCNNPKKSYDQTDIETSTRRYNDYLITNFDDLKAKGKVPQSWALKAIKDTFTGYDEVNDSLVFNHCNLSGQPINLQWHKGKQRGQSESKLFPLNLIPKYDKNSFLVFSEGCKDAVTLLSNEINTVTNTTGAGSIPKDLNPLKDFQRIYIVYDNDQPGIKGSHSLANKLNYEFPEMDIGIVKWENKPERYDVTDYFSGGHTKIEFFEILLNSKTFKRPYTKPSALRYYFGLKVFKNPKLWQLYCICLYRASTKQEIINWSTGIGSITVHLQSGQLIYGRNQWAKELKVKPSTLDYRIKNLQELGTIRIEANNQYSIISICNYNTCQP